MSKKHPAVTITMIDRYLTHLREQERDLSRLADILGHSSIVTTRIYTAESGAIHARQMGRLGLVIT
mgnify:FL=1